MYIYSLTPHSHFRGVASNFVAEYPDGTKEVAVGAQVRLQLADHVRFRAPKLIPKGTKLTHSTTYDNSSLNPANPDPSIVVHWGEQSWEEMIYGTISYRYADEAPTTSRRPR